MPDGDAEEHILVAVPNSERPPVPEARRTGDADPDERVTVTIVVRRRSEADLGAAPARPEGTAPAAWRTSQREEFAARAGAEESDLDAVASYAEKAGLRVVSSDAARRTVMVEGTVATVGRAFAVSLGRYESDGVSYRGREGAVRVPAYLAGLVEAVLGLDDRPQARPRPSLGGVRGDPPAKLRRGGIVSR